MSENLVNKFLLPEAYHPQGSTCYPFLLLFHIEDNVHFKFGGVSSRIQNFFKNPTFVSPYLF